jgi:hypothetical protein
MKYLKSCSLGVKQESLTHSVESKFSKPFNWPLHGDGMINIYTIFELLA